MIITSSPDFELPLEDLNDQQQLDLFQVLQRELIENPAESWAASHANVLSERLAREARGESEWRDVDESFARIRQQIDHDRQD